MRRRAVAVVAGLAVLMSLFGLGVYRLLGHFKHLDNSAATRPPDRPQDTKPAVVLPGTLYLSQGGDLFTLHGTDFKELIAHDSVRGDWVQPALLSDGSLLAVARADASSSLYQLAADGTVTRQLVAGAATTLSDGSLENNHWVFHPRLGPDGTTLWFSYDSPKNGFLVDLAVWAMPLAAGTASPSPTPSAHATVRPVLPAVAKRWTTPNDYTGGDVDPVPLISGGVVFTRYSIDAQDKIHSQLWYTGSPSDDGRALTAPEEDCSQPDISPDGTELAMVCTNGDQLARVVVAPLLSAPPATAGAPTPTPTPSARRPSPTPTPAPKGPYLGAERVVVDGALAAQPVWAPDGSGLAFLAPAETGANFQLWWLAGAASSSPAAPAQVTQSLGFDATSRPAWSAR